MPSAFLSFVGRGKHYFAAGVQASRLEVLVRNIPQSLRRCKWPAPGPFVPDTDRSKAASASAFWQLEVDFDWLGIVYAGDIEAEKVTEFTPVAGEVGQGGKIFGADLGPDFHYGLLDVGLHFQVVHADAGGAVKAGRV